MMPAAWCQRRSAGASSAVTRHLAIGAAMAYGFAGSEEGTR